MGREFVVAAAVLVGALAWVDRTSLTWRDAALAALLVVVLLADGSVNTLPSGFSTFKDRVQARWVQRHAGTGREGDAHLFGTVNLGLGVAAAARAAVVVLYRPLPSGRPLLAATLTALTLTPALVGLAIAEHRLRSGSRGRRLATPTDPAQHLVSRGERGGPASGAATMTPDDDPAKGAVVSDQYQAGNQDRGAGSGWVDEDGLWWCVPGGGAAVRGAWFRALVAALGAGDVMEGLRREGFAVEADVVPPEAVFARHPSGVRVVGDASVPLLCAALCYWEEYNPKWAADPAQYARQRAAFERAYEAVRAVGLGVLGEPSLQGRDRDELEHRWTAWRVGEVLVAVYQAAGDVQFGLSIQLDARRFPADATLAPWSSSFVDWMWSDQR
jgi:hypothetical protein